MSSQPNVIFAYTIDDAIADGFAVDVSHTPEAKEAGFKFDVVLTQKVFGDCVKWTEEDAKRTGNPQDEKGRLWDVLYMAAAAVRRFNRTKQQSNTITFQVMRQPRKPGKGRIVQLQTVLESRSNFDPVIVIRFPNED